MNPTLVVLIPMIVMPHLLEMTALAVSYKGMSILFMILLTKVLGIISSMSMELCITIQITKYSIMLVFIYLKVTTVPVPTVNISCGTMVQEYTAWGRHCHSPNLSETSKFDFFISFFFSLGPS